MAKQQNRGLGRGLNSLLGGSAEEAIPAEETAKPRYTVKEEKPAQQTPKRATEKIETKQDARPKREETTIPEISEEDAVVTIREKSAKRAKPAEQIAPDLKDDDNVTIKGVVERKPDEVPLTSVKPNPDQPRTNFDSEELEELASSIEKDGLLQPILVRPVGKEYQIIAGERRWQACKSLGLSTIPVRVKDADDDKALELALIENIQRSDLNPIEEAYGYRRLMDRQGFTQSEVAQAVSKGRSTVANALRLLELPEAAQQMLFEDKISAGHARAILSIPSKDGKEKLTNKLLEEKLSVRESETYARLLAGAKSGDQEGATTRVPTPLVFKKVARALRDSLETNVKVKTVKGRNKIEIEFSDEDELEQLFEKLTAFQG